MVYAYSSERDSSTMHLNANSVGFCNARAMLCNNSYAQYLSTLFNSNNYMLLGSPIFALHNDHKKKNRQIRLTKMSK